jgi:DMSO reductase anchor subunit
MRGKLTTADKRCLSHYRKGLYSRPLLGKLVNWTVLILLFITVLTVIFYVTGSYRNVSDESQLALLRFCLAVSMLLVISAVYGFILDLYYTVRKKKPAFLAFALGYILIMAMGAAAFFGAAFIISAAGGNRS